MSNSKFFLQAATAISLPLLASDAIPGTPIIHTDRAVFEALLLTVVTDDYSNAGDSLSPNKATMSGVLGETDYQPTGFANNNRREVPHQGAVDGSRRLASHRRPRGHAYEGVTAHQELFFGLSYEIGASWASGPALVDQDDTSEPVAAVGEDELNTKMAMEPSKAMNARASPRPSTPTTMKTAVPTKSPTTMSTESTTWSIRTKTRPRATRRVRASR